MSQLAVESSIRVKASIEESYILGNRYPTLNVNKMRFVIFDTAIIAKRHLNINLQDRSVILISPMTSHASLQINAISIIALNTIEAAKGLSLVAEGTLIYLSTEAICCLNGRALAGKTGKTFKVIHPDILNGLVKKFKKGVNTKNSEILLRTLIETTKEAMSKDSDVKGHSDLDALLRLGIPVIESRYRTVDNY